MKRLTFLFVLLLILVPETGLALSLEEGLKIVAEQGRDVRIARSSEEQARSAVSLARAPWLPSLDLYARETWLRYQPASVLPFSVPNAPSSIPVSQDQFLTYGFRATQLLYDFGRTSSNISSAQYGLRSREIETRRTKNGSSLEFIIAYLDLLEAEKLLQVAGEEVQQYEAHQKDADARYKAGVVTKNEVLQAQVTLADSRQRAVNAENLRSVRASRVNSLLMRPLNDEIKTEEVKASPATGVTLEQAWTVAEAENDDLKDMDARISATQENVRATQAEYLPTFYLSGGYEYSENRYMVHDDNWTLIAGVNVNLLSGGASSSRISMARSEVRSLQLAREKVLDNVRLDVKRAYLDLQSSQQKIEVTKTAVEQAQENLRLQRLRYQEGVGTATDVLDAVTLLSTAESNSWKALYALKRAEANLLASMGRDVAELYTK